MEHKYIKLMTNEFSMFIWTEEKKMEIRDDLLETLNQTGKDFFYYWPIEAIEQLFEKNWENIDMRTLSTCINNLYLRVLGDKIWEKYTNSYKHWDSYNITPEKPRSPLEEKIFKSNKEIDLFVHSKKWRNQTPAELAEECKKGAEKCWFKIDELVQEFNEMRSLNNELYYLDEENENDKKKIEKIYQFRKRFLLKMSKIYIYLRKEWYSHADII